MTSPVAARRMWIGANVGARSNVTDDLIRGDVDVGYGRVADAFRRNFEERGEIGAACCVYREGRKVVDLWGGFRDGTRRLPWEPDTIVTVMSLTKGMAAIPLALAHSRGLLDFDEMVATYWPEFAQHGKDQTTVRQLLSHQAGLPVIDANVDPDMLDDPDAIAEVLARQVPLWEPGTRHGYHAVSLGLFEAELLRRVDPQARTLGRYFAEEIAALLDLEFYIGLPDDLPDERRATLHTPKPSDALKYLHRMPLRYVAGLVNPRSPTRQALTLPGIPVMADPDIVNRREFLAPELAAINGTGQVRSVARAYGCLATGGRELGLTHQTLQALEAPAVSPTGGVRDAVLRFDTSYSLGYIKPTSRYWFGTSQGRAFGMPGGGGSMGFADPELGLGYAYAPNRISVTLPPDPRSTALEHALYDTIGEPLPRTKQPPRA